MTFRRKPAENWHRQVPSDRRFKTDLHIHTMDRQLGGKACLPGATGRSWPFGRTGTAPRASSRIGLVGGTHTRIENVPLAGAGARI